MNVKNTISFTEEANNRFEADSLRRRFAVRSVPGAAEQHVRSLLRVSREP